jgi:hypothetical protein
MSPIARQAAKPTKKPVQNIGYPVQNKRGLCCAAVAILRRTAVNGAIVISWGKARQREPAGLGQGDELGTSCAQWRGDLPPASRCPSSELEVGASGPDADRSGAAALPASVNPMRPSVSPTE